MKNNVQSDDMIGSARAADFFHGSISHPLQTEHLSCVVRDFSQDTALVELPSAGDLPVNFWLRLEGEDTLRLCTVMARSKSSLMVSFGRQITERRGALRLTLA